MNRGRVTAVSPQYRREFPHLPLPLPHLRFFALSPLPDARSGIFRQGYLTRPRLLPGDDLKLREPRVGLEELDDLGEALSD